jgi:hypothetical protein
VQPCVALAADHFVAVVLARQDHERRLNDPTAQAQHQVKCRLLLDVVVRQRAAVLQLLAREDQALLIRRDALLVLDLGFDILNSVRALHLQRDGLARQCLDEDLHFALPGDQLVTSLPISRVVLSLTFSGASESANSHPVQGTVTVRFIEDAIW